MVKKRVIGVILVREEHVVQSVNFEHTNIIHYNPIVPTYYFYIRGADEIVILNVSRDPSSAEYFPNIISKVSKYCFVPISAGGWVRDLDYARKLLESGADKIVINTHAFEDKRIVGELAKKFGSQCVVVSIDSKMVDGKRRVCIDRGRKVVDKDPVEWAREVENMGAGELLVNSIDHDGARKGYDLELMRHVSEAVNIPVIAFGGAALPKHFLEGFTKGKADAVAAANIFHYTEYIIKQVKDYLINHGIPIRKYSSIKTKLPFKLE